MKDDRFNKLMGKYVDSTKRGKDTDLQKLINRSEDEKNVQKSIPKYVWVLCTMLIVVMVSLSIVLPIVLNKEESPQSFYCDNFQIQETEVNEILEFKEKYNFDCVMPSIQFIEAYLSVMTYKENNQNFGLFMEMSIFDENFDSITFNVVKQPYIMVQLQYFDNFTDNVKWRNTLVRYSIKYEDNASYYSYAMTFTIGNYNYFINFDSFSQMSVTEALDIIYRVDVKK